MLPAFIQKEMFRKFPLFAVSFLSIAAMQETVFLTLGRYRSAVTICPVSLAHRLKRLCACTDR